MSSPLHIRAVLAVVLMSMGWSALAGNDRYGATLAGSAWVMQDGKDKCLLSHSVPQLGEARFTQSAGSKLSFSLTIPQESQFAERVSWRSVPLPWKHDATAADLGNQPLPANSKTLVLSPEDSLRLYLELERGMSTDFLFSDGHQDRTAITVSVSGVRFTGQIHAFQTCVAGLIKLADAHSKKSAGKVTAEFPVPFASNSYELEDDARKILGDLARDYRIGKSRDRILVAGHTDAQETPDSTARLALRRAREIKGYLVRRGLPADRIELRQAGKRVKAAGESDDLHARATIWLVN